MSNKILDHVDHQMQDHLVYWKQLLADAPQVLDLPRDHPRLLTQYCREFRQTFTLPGRLTEALHNFSPGTDGMLHTILTAAFQVLLYRYTGQNDFLIGTATTSKSSETQESTDDHLRTLVLHANIAGDPTFCELLQRVEKVILLAHQHDDIPFERIANTLHLDESSLHSLFQVMISYRPLSSVLSPERTVLHTDEYTNKSIADLHLEIVDQPEGLICNFVYNADIFDASTISRMYGHWQTLLEGIVADPMQRLTELSLLTEEERHLLLIEWNNTAHDYPKDQCVHQLFEAQVELTPDAIAVCFHDDYLTYGQLNRRANQVARYLHTLGVGPDVLVGICMERSLEMVIGLLGVLKAGGAYVPLDPSYPAERLAFMLEDAQAPVLLTQQRLREVLPAHKATSIYLDSDWDTIAQEEDTNPASDVRPLHLAYVIYTSGSTGKPKGVMIPHQGLVNYLSWCTRAYAVAEGQGTLVHSPLGFDLTVTSLFAPLLVGQKAILLPEDKGTEALYEALDNNDDVTLVKITPAHLKLLSQTLPVGNAAKARTLVIGGEALLAEDISFWRTYAPATRLINEYGPTETVVGCCIYEVPAATSLSGPISIGRPIANTQLYILDAHLQPVPINVPGELYIGGAGVARGYLNRPELTAERFIPHPWSTEPNARLYKTGDLARYRADGNIEFLGRLDHQVKIRGFRIELGEIETVLEVHPKVQKAIVVAHEASPGDTRLVAYIHFKDGQAVTVEDLQTYVADQVPNYMIPSALVEIDTFPLTANGKVDRRALPAPDYTSARQSRQITTPRTSTEEIIAQTWSQVLGVASISIDDDFFALGGHSLLAMRVIASLRTTFHVELPLRSFFEAPTVAQLAQLIGQQQSGTISSSLLPMIQAIPREQYRFPVGSISSIRHDERLTEEVILPASLNQQSLWLVDQMEQGSAAYNLSTTLRLHTNLDMEALQQSIQALAERHETLRTTFALLNEQLMQVIAPTMKVAIAVVDLQELPEGQRDAKMKRLISSEIQQRFDLTHGPLIRATVFHLGAEEHVLLLVLHHIISDGWSEGLLCRDLSAFYDAFTTGRPASLPALPVQYADFALWQREHWQQERISEQLDHWKQHLAGVPPVLELPGDRPRPAISTHKGRVYTFALSTSTTQRLKSFSKQESVTLYTTLMAAFTALLHRYTEQDDLVLGTVTAGRNQQETHDLIGYFVNTLVLRNDLSGNPTIHELLTRVRETVLAAQAHQEVSFEQLVKELQPERSLSVAPLIQVLLTLDPPLPAFSSQWELTSLGLETGSAKFDLALALAERPEGLLGSVEYSTDLFEEATIARMMHHWQIVLEAMIADPAQPLSQLPLLTPIEQEQLLAEGQAPEIPLAQTSLPRLIEDQVARTPNAVALVFEEQELTYRDLNSRVNRLAHHLQTLGVGPEVMVGLCVERSMDMIVGLLAILKAGGVYVPMDPAYPRERLAFLIDDTRMPILLTQQHLLTQFPEQKLHLVCLDTDEELIAQQSQENVVSEATGEQSAYVIYTSGSTGHPKGVLVSHGVLATHCQIMIDAFDLQADDRVLQFSAITFDPSLEQILATLLAGARIVVRGPEVWSPTELREKAKLYGLTSINLPAAYWHQVAQDWANVPQALLPTSLRLMVAGGEKLVPETLHLWQQTGLRSVRLVNAYGPTETTIAATLYDIDCWSEATLAADTVPIGRPLPNRRLYILDRNDNLVPRGVVGELHIGGPLLARGYLNRPELTAERFVADPFNDDPSARMYRTGDLVRYRADGMLEFVGRADQQVKIRGFRVELGEIEAVLRQHPAVNAAVVMARGDMPGDIRLVAYVVLRENESIREAELQSHAASSVPGYMVPAAVVLLDALPLTNSGKVDRRSLPAPEYKQHNMAGERVAPRTPLEEEVAQAWSRALSIESIGIHEDFFALGGHSLLAMQVASRLRGTLQVELPLRTFFEAPTIAQLTERIRHLQADKAAPSLLPSIQAVPRTSYRRPTSALPDGEDEKGIDEVVVMPTSLQQQGLWVVDQLESDSPPAYNVPLVLRLRDYLDVAVLEQSLQALVERHETLRTTFMLIDDQPMQIIASKMHVPLKATDLRGLSAEQQKIEVERLLTQEIQQPFDLAHGPLLRGSLLHLEDQEHLVLLLMHHIISDGWSVGVLVQELAELYETRLSGSHARLEELPIQYADFALWQREWLQGARLDEQLSYWKETLAGAPPVLALPTDRPRPAQPTHRGARYRFSLSEQLSKGLKHMSQQEGITQYMLLVAGFVTLLQRYTGQGDMLIGTTTAGRNYQETKDLIGYFVNTLVLRNDLSDNPTVHELFARVRETVLAAQAHQEVSFEQLVKELQPERSLSFAPLIQVLLTLDPPLPTFSSQWELTSLGLETGSAKFDLTLALAERPEGLLGSVEYSTDLFEEVTIARMMRHWQVLLEAMIADPAQSLAQLPLLTPTEQEQLLVQYQASEVALAQTRLPQLIEDQVARTPDTIALAFEEQELTYRDLNIRVNRLAHHLQALGVGPEVMVGMCVERSVNMIIGLLAILKAGGVYVPMDPAYPRERLSFIIEDTRMPILLTQQHLVAQFPKQHIQLVCLDTDEELIAQQSQENVVSEVTREQSAYVIYTSGSTGQPKGVPVSHTALATHCQIMIDAFELRADDRVLQFSAITFDPSLEQILATLLVGARVVVRGPDVWSPAELRDKVKMYGLTVANLPTAYWHHVAQDWASVPRAELPTSLRLLTAGGDRVVAEALRFWQQTGLHSVRLLNAYGPTEATITATIYDIDCWSEATLAADTVPIGRPLPNRKLYILDHAGNLVPRGVVGELHIGGSLLARGYLNRPELTAERFVADPFSTHSDARMYRTGDLVRYRADGMLEFVGRADQQVKIRGFRIELGEIEATLSQHPDVREVVMLAHEGASGDKALVAYMVADQGKKLEVSELRGYLKERLPEYMLPAAFVPMDALPLLPTGKINRNALPAPELKKLAEEDSFVAPKLLVHQQLAQIWEELLDVRPIGIKDNFFYLGGHSLLAARLVDRIKHVFGRSIVLSTLFSGPTIEQLAEALHQQGDTGTRASLLPVQVSGSKRPLFFMHGDWTGGAFYCFALGRVLGPDQPFYVLEPYKFNGLQTLPSFKEVARAHIEAIRAVQPQGPYLLGGFCNGGLFAYEMARQLEADGEQVDFLGLINPTGPIQYESLRTVSKRIGKFLPISERLQTNLLIRTRHALRHIYRILFPNGERIQDFGKLLEIDPRLNAMFPPIDALYNDYVGGFAGIISRYETGDYSGKMTFYWASEEPGIENVWLPVTGAKNSEDIENYVVPGTHMSCVTDHIQELAQCFSSSLQKAQTNIQNKVQHA